MREVVCITLLVLGLLSRQAGAFLNTQTRLRPKSNRTSDKMTQNTSVLVRYSTRDTKLYLDLFGLGPSEVVIVAVAAALLYGPEKVRGQLRDSGVSNSVVNSKGLRLEREERIDKMLDDAEERRKKRAWQRINVLIDSEDEETLSKLESINSDGPVK